MRKPLTVLLLMVVTGALSRSVHQDNDAISDTYYNHELESEVG